MGDTEKGPAEGGKAIFAKLFEAMKLVENVEKKGRNDFHRYDYARAEDVIRAARHAFLEVGLVLIPAAVGESREPVGQKGEVVTTLNLRFTVADPDSGESVSGEWIGWGSDKGDKGGFKAFTGGLKYFLTDLLLIPYGDDPEADTKLDADRSTQGRPAKKAEPPKAKAKPKPKGLSCVSCGEAEYKDMRRSKNHPDVDYVCPKCGDTIHVQGVMASLTEIVKELRALDAVSQKELDRLNQIFVEEKVDALIVAEGLFRKRLADHAEKANAG